MLIIFQYYSVLPTLTRRVDKLFSRQGRGENRRIEGTRYTQNVGHLTAGCSVITQSFIFFLFSKTNKTNSVFTTFALFHWWEHRKTKMLAACTGTVKKKTPGMANQETQRLPASMKKTSPCEIFYGFYGLHWKLEKTLALLQNCGLVKSNEDASKILLNTSEHFSSYHTNIYYYYAPC